MSAADNALLKDRHSSMCPPKNVLMPPGVAKGPPMSASLCAPIAQALVVKMGPVALDTEPMAWPFR